MKFTSLLVFVLACVAVVSIALIEGGLLPEVAETERSVVQFKPLYIPSSRIDQSPAPRSLVEKATSSYAEALEYAPVLPAPPMGNGRINPRPFRR